MPLSRPRRAAQRLRRLAEGADEGAPEQAHLIYNGIQSGSISFNESQKLAQGQARVHNLENQAKSNGVVTPIERARIHAAQNIQSARIFLEKH